MIVSPFAPAFKASLAFTLITLGSVLVACASGGASSGGEEGFAYDGTAESMDSLPDCIPELAGSSFWVREKKGAFDCMKTGEWKNRRSAQAPDDIDEAPGAWTPRLIEK